MRFYEQTIDKRVIIAPHIPADAIVVREVDAECWIEAKQRLGYALSAIQEWLLGQFYERNKLAKAE